MFEIWIFPPEWNCASRIPLSRQIRRRRRARRSSSRGRTSSATAKSPSTASAARTSIGLGDWPSCCLSLSFRPYMVGWYGSTTKIIYCASSCIYSYTMFMGICITQKVEGSNTAQTKGHFLQANLSPYIWWPFNSYTTFWAKYTLSMFYKRHWNFI